LPDQVADPAAIAKIAGLLLSEPERKTAIASISTAVQEVTDGSGLPEAV
jgi:hypothetical protein